METDILLENVEICSEVNVAVRFHFERTVEDEQTI